MTGHPIVTVEGRPLVVRPPTRIEATLGAEEAFERDGFVLFTKQNGLTLVCTCRQAACEHRRAVRVVLRSREQAANDRVGV